jgi:hypothetical protein
VLDGAANAYAAAELRAAAWAGYPDAPAAYSRQNGGVTFKVEKLYQESSRVVPSKESSTGFEVQIGSKAFYSWTIAEGGNNGANSGGTSWVGLGRDFAHGFTNAEKSDMQSTSAFLGYAGIPIAKNEALLKHTAKTASGWANKAAALRGVKGIAIAGKTLGAVGAVMTGIESAFDSNGFTVGDGVKVGIGLVTTFGGPLGLAYGVIDIGWGMYTGTTITDRIGSGIDNAMK